MNTPAPRPHGVDQRADGRRRDRTGLVRDSKDAWEPKDIGALVGLLDPDATMTADGGGLVAHHGGIPVTVAALDFADGRIVRIWAVRNPEELSAWTESGRI